MMRLLAMLLVSMVVSGYYFPFNFSFFHIANTKMILAVTGILLVVYQGCRKNGIIITKEFMGAVGLAFIFSFICFISINYNHTDDYSYVTYFSSFFTWLGGAYTVCAAIRVLHGKATLSLLGSYLAFVCAVQCILSQLIDRIPSFQILVDTYIEQGQWFYKQIDRLYGIGASLDPAGVRFSIVLLLIAYLLCEDNDIRQDRKKITAYLLCFFLISVLGNMISRTTTVGMIMGLGYIIYSTGIFRLIILARSFKFYSVFGSLLVVFALVGTYLYQADADFYKNIRFAFEGFFSWVETGQWSTDSTDKLNTEMWIWPDSFESWIIGTGIFGNWSYGTDIGYCRFILYCGLTGFGAFVSFFVYNTWVFARKFPSFRLLSLGLLALSFLIWIKVATDLFLIYALFYCLDEGVKQKPKLSIE
ncbi:hypothetical protein [Bacteroides congonensis]|uniref:hypothetical protein n=1 Tax=Bacteroides congonensis TaxID=1871006 RepID=UPI002FDA67E6